MHHGKLRKMAVLYLAALLALPGMYHASGSSRADSVGWYQFGGDAGHTNTAAGLKQVLRPYIYMDLGDIESASGVFGNLSANIVLNGTTEMPWPWMVGYTASSELRLADSRTGQVVWKAALPYTAVISPAVYDANGNGRMDIVVVSSEGNISAYEPVIFYNGTGYSWGGTAPIWSSTVQDTLTSSGIMVHADALYVAGSDGIWCLNASTGSVAWHRSLPGNLSSTPTLLRAGSTQRVVVSSYSAPVLYIDAFDLQGNRLWERNITAAPSPFQPVQLPSLVSADFNGDGSEEVLAAHPLGLVDIYRSNGTSLWSSPYAAGMFIEATPAAARADSDSAVEAVLAGWRNQTFNLQARVVALKGTGRPLWQSTLDRDLTSIERVVSSPVVGASGVTVALYSGRVYSLNLSTGAEVWNASTGRYTPLTSSPLLGDLRGMGYCDVFVEGMGITHQIPEFSVDYIQLNRTAVWEGEPVAATAVLRNDGTMDASQVNVTFYDLYDYTETLLGTTTVDLSAMDTASADVVYTPHGGGDHTLRVVVDPGNAYQEISEGNNQGVFTYYVESHWTVELSCQNNVSVIDPGEQHIYKITARNRGDREYNLTTDVHGVPQGWDAVLTQEAMNLRKGEQKDFFLIVTSPSDAVSGTYLINVTATVNESSENHATAVTTTIIRGTYGISLSTPDAWKNGTPGGYVIFDVNITNTGNSKDTYTLTYQCNWTSTLNASTVEVREKSWAHVEYIVLIPADAPEHTSEACRISAYSHGDPYQKDNLTVHVQVVKPDYTVESMEFIRLDGAEVDGKTRRLIDGEEFHVNITVRNVLSNVDRNRVGLTLLVNGTAVNTTELEFGQNSPGRCSIPLTLPAGNHTLTAAVDPGDRVPEANESNNTVTESIMVKDANTTGPYIVYGTVYWENRRPIVGAEVSVTNMRTGMYESARTGINGNYTFNLYELPGRYREGDVIKVTADNGITTRNVTFRAYSEDYIRHIDIYMIPGPYDFFLSVSNNTVSAQPGTPAYLSFEVVQMGSSQNTVELWIEDLPQYWKAVFMDANGTYIHNVTVPPRGSTSVYLEVTPSAQQEVSEGIPIYIAASSVHSDKVQRSLVVVQVLQVHSLVFSYSPMECYSNEAASEYLPTIQATAWST